MAISILCKLPPPFFETVLTFEVQHIRTAAAGRFQQENLIERHSSVSFRVGFSFAVRKGANVSHRLRTGTEPSWKYIYRRTHYRPMTQNHHRHVYGTGRSSLWGSSFSYRTACREVNPNDPINNRKEDYIHDRSSIQQHRYTAHIQRILEERRTAPTVCTSHNVLETRCTASRSR